MELSEHRERRKRTNSSSPNQPWHAAGLKDHRALPASTRAAASSSMASRGSRAFWAVKDGRVEPAPSRHSQRCDPAHSGSILEMRYRQTTPPSDRRRERTQTGRRAESSRAKRQQPGRRRALPRSFVGRAESLVRELSMAPLPRWPADPKCRDDSRGVMFVIRGKVRTIWLSSAGRKVSFRDLGPGAIFGELSAIDGEPRSANDLVP
jgi:hypothetical protein